MSALIARHLHSVRRRTGAVPGGWRKGASNRGRAVGREGLFCRTGAIAAHGRDKGPENTATASADSIRDTEAKIKRRPSPSLCHTQEPGRRERGAAMTSERTRNDSSAVPLPRDKQASPSLQGAAGVAQRPSPQNGGGCGQNLPLHRSEFTLRGSRSVSVPHTHTDGDARICGARDRGAHGGAAHAQYRHPRPSDAELRRREAQRGLGLGLPRRGRLRRLRLRRLSRTSSRGASRRCAPCEDPPTQHPRNQHGAHARAT